MGTIPVKTARHFRQYIGYGLKVSKKGERSLEMGWKGLHEGKDNGFCGDPETSKPAARGLSKMPKAPVSFLAKYPHYQQFHTGLVKP